MTGPVTLRRGRPQRAGASRRGALLSAVLAGIAIVGAAASVAVVQPTAAAWTDRAYASATVTAGSWSTAPTGPISPTIVQPGAGTVIASVAWNIANSRSACVSVTVKGTSATPSVWSFTISTAGAPFYGSTLTQSSTRLSADGGVYTATSWNPTGETVSTTTSRTYSVCADNVGVAALGDASWYQVTQSKGTWDEHQKCMVLTATGTITASPDNLAFFGWTGTLDLTQARQEFAAAGRPVYWEEWIPSDASSFSAVQTSADRYTITSGQTTSIRGTGSMSITRCLHSN